MHFANTSSSKTDPPRRRAFEQNPDWWPKRLNPFITDCCYKLRRLIFKHVRKPVHRILTSAEIKALRDLKLNPNIVIKKADNSQDDSYKVKSDADCIPRDLFTPNTPTFYGIPKIHKANYPLRPIVSQIHGPTSGISLLVDKLLFVAEQKIPFLLQNTTAYLNSIDEHKLVSPNTLLVTMGVTSICTNIPHDEGIQLVADFLPKPSPFGMTLIPKSLPFL
jgi:hypothetical protein